MFFNSIAFLVFFLVFFQLYWLINNKFSVKYRNLFVLVSSYFFYGSWDWRFLILLFFSSTVDFLLGKKIAQAESIKTKKFFLSCSLVFSLGILGFFKYFNFFVSSLQELFLLFHLPLNTYTLHILLPVGISFYTFQSLSYTIDVYRGKLAPEKNFLSFLTFVSFFPQLVAGPIERATHLLKQFHEKKQFDYNNCISGLRLVLWGLFKKVVIADNLAQIVNDIFNPICNFSGGITLLGAVLFAFQIYGDFSGYSDMAVGLSKMIGFDLMRNFISPYFSSSMTEFWRRWHVSLSTWFRDYVYIPLGGSEKGSLRTKLNVLLTFILSGLWHGARSTFLIWGFAHGMILIIEKSIKVKVTNWIRIPFVFMITAILWIPFRAESYKHLVQLILSLRSFKNFSTDMDYLIESFRSPIKIIVVMITLLLFLLLDKKTTLLNFDGWIQNKNKIMRYGIYYWLFLSILFLGNLNIKPSFIYFQF
jgi:alginate O-acetyltransferase complex protein AlgI